MGSFHSEPIMPPETHIGYAEGYLDALEKVRELSRRYGDIEAICFIIRLNLKTVIDDSKLYIPGDLTGFPSTTQLLRGAHRG